MPDLYKMDCGCSFPIYENRDGKRPFIIVNPNILPDCKKVWEMLGEGKTKGIFQLESPIGRQWAKELKPENIEQLAALSAILRPGVRNVSDENNRSYTKKYCLRKNGHEEITYKYASLEPILKSTYGLMIYQEQMLKIAELFAGFSLLEQDQLRKGVGKKDQSIVAKVGINFVEKGIKLGILTKEQLEEVFEEIKKSGRYLFNKSHAISYALKGYQTAYIKAHITNDFFAGWLLNAHADSNPREEVYELVEDAKAFGIQIKPPYLLSLEPSITTDGDSVQFGLADVKNVGEKMVEKLGELIKNNKPKDWTSFLYSLHGKGIPSTTAIKSWISSGAMSWTKLSRNRMLKEYVIWNDLNDTIQLWIFNNCQGKPLVEALKLAGKKKSEGGPCSKITQITHLESLSLILSQNASSDEDFPNQIIDMEEATLGVPITYQRIDCVDNELADTTCKQIKDGKNGNSTLAVEVKEVKEMKIKNGKNAGSLYGRGIISDSTSSIPFIIWSEQWVSFKDIFKIKNTVLVKGKKDNYGEAFIINFAAQL